MSKVSRAWHRHTLCSFSDDCFYNSTPILTKLFEFHRQLLRHSLDTGVVQECKNRLPPSLNFISTLFLLQNSRWTDHRCPTTWQEAWDLLAVSCVYQYQQCGFKLNTLTPMKDGFIGPWRRGLAAYIAICRLATSALCGNFIQATATSTTTRTTPPIGLWKLRLPHNDWE